MDHHIHQSLVGLEDRQEQHRLVDLVRYVHRDLVVAQVLVEGVQDLVPLDRHHQS